MLNLFWTAPKMKRSNESSKVSRVERTIRGEGIMVIKTSEQTKSMITITKIIFSTSDEGVKF